MVLVKTSLSSHSFFGINHLYKTDEDLAEFTAIVCSIIIVQSAEGSLVRDGKKSREREFTNVN